MNSDSSSKPSTQSPAEKPSLAACLLVILVQIYQYSLSPVLSMMGVGCRYAPTCSGYAIDALKLHGARRGSMMAARRVLRCHPWHEGGYDPVPDK